MWINIVENQQDVKNQDIEEMLLIIIFGYHHDWIKGQFCRSHLVPQRKDEAGMVTLIYELLQCLYKPYKCSLNIIA